MVRATNRYRGSAGPYKASFHASERSRFPPSRNDTRRWDPSVVFLAALPSFRRRPVARTLVVCSQDPPVCLLWDGPLRVLIELLPVEPLVLCVGLTGVDTVDCKARWNGRCWWKKAESCL